MTQDRPGSGPAKGGPPGEGDGLAASCALTCLAGWVDALAVLSGAELLPVYVTGDTTKLASALVGGAWDRAWPPVVLVLAFLSSSVLAARLGRVTAGARPAPVLLLVGGFLLAGLLLAPGDGRWTLATLLPVAAAMGALNQALAKDPGVTFITGALVRASRALSAGAFLRAGRDLLRWACFLAGAAGGAVMNGAAGRYALAVPAAAALLAGATLALRGNAPTEKEA